MNEIRYRINQVRKMGSVCSTSVLISDVSTEEYDSRKGFASCKLCIMDGVCLEYCGTVTEVVK